MHTVKSHSSTISLDIQFRILEYIWNKVTTLTFPWSNIKVTIIWVLLHQKFDAIKKSAFCCCCYFLSFRTYSHSSSTNTKLKFAKNGRWTKWKKKKKKKSKLAATLSNTSFIIGKYAEVYMVYLKHVRILTKIDVHFSK